MTIPANASHASEGMRFVQYAAKNSGNMLGRYGLQALSPPLLYNNTAPPNSSPKCFHKESSPKAGT